MLIKYEGPGREQYLSNCHVEGKETTQPTDDGYAGQDHSAQLALLDITKLTYIKSFIFPHGNMNVSRHSEKEMLLICQIISG